MKPAMKPDESETEKPRRRGLRKGELPISHLLPNLMTVAAICAGLSAIRFAIHGHYELAVQLILVASVLDGLDGRLARMLKSESAIGAELDSLADFLNFGVAPGLLIYLWGFGEFQNQGWVAVVIYAVCCVMRLARFNVGNKSEISDTPKRFFTGVPAPAGAFLALLPLFAAFALHRPQIWPPEVIAVYLVLVGLLMISRIPTWSVKSVTIHRENARLFLIGAVAVVTLLVSYPWMTMAALDIAYMLGILWSWRVAKKG